MLYYFLYSLKKYWFPFNVFRYITFRAMVSAVFSFVLTWIFLRFYIKKWALKWGFVGKVREDTPERHQNKKNIPFAGGVIFILSSLISIFMWSDLKNKFVIVSIVGIFLLSLLGFVDDILKRNSKGLSAKIKFISQFGLSVLIVFLMKDLYEYDLLTKTQFLFFKNFFIDFGLLYVFFVMIVFVGATNAVNLSDGLDGLAGGMLLAPLGLMSVVCYIEGHVKLSKYLNVLYLPGIGELFIVGMSFGGGVLAFLWYNSYPAEVFMGDVGAEGLGGVLGMMAILSKQEILLAVGAGMFVLESLSVILQVGYFKLTKGKRIFKMTPLHHHFEKIGWDENKIVIRFWILSLIFTLIAFSTLKIR